MAINLNANLANTAGGRMQLGAATGIFNAPAPAPAAPAPAAPPPAALTFAAPPPAAVAATPVLSTISPGVLQVPPIFRPPILTPPILVPPVVAPPQNRTATQLANAAISQLNSAAPASVTTALNAIRSKALDGPGLIPYLERKVRIGEVLNDLAKDWSAATRGDFAAAFSMDANNLNNEVLDSIVSVAILNDKEIAAEILGENTPQTTPADLLDNRKIVWQSVAPGTPLNPPYVILVAVQYQDIATAQDVLNGIMNQLGTTSSGFKLPASVIQKGVN